MKIAAFVVSHPQASTEVRERLQAATAEIRNHFRKSVILSTCHRFEIYLPRETENQQEIASHPNVCRRLASVLGLETEMLTRTSRFFSGQDAAEHLFRVASGLESAVLGENEILGQVRTSLEEASHSGKFGVDLRAVFESALRTGKKVRSQTSLGQGATSLATAALGLIKNRIPKEIQNATRILILGSGEMASRLALLLKDRGFADLRVVSRSLANADRLASRIGASSHTLDEIPDLLRNAEVAVSLLSDAPGVLKEVMFDFLSPKHERPFLLIDMALPRNAEPAIRRRPGLELFDIDDLARSVEASVEQRREEISAAETLISEELQKLSTVFQTNELPAHRRRLRNLRQREALLSEEEAFEPASISYSVEGEAWASQGRKTSIPE